VIRPQYHFRRAGPDILIWDVEKLLDLAAPLPVEEVPLGRIAEIDEPYWFDISDRAPTCRAVAEHGRMIAAADLAWPVLLAADGRIMDGMHRVMKALLEGRATIPARRFPVTPEPDFRNMAMEDLPR